MNDFNVRMVKRGIFLKSFAIKLLFHNNDLGPRFRSNSFDWLKTHRFPNYSKADWQQKKTDTWLLSSESRHERVAVAAGLLELVATGGDADVVPVVVADAVEPKPATAAAAAAAFDDAGLTLIVPVLDAELKWCVGVSVAAAAAAAVAAAVVPDSVLGDELPAVAEVVADVVAVEVAGP